MSNILVIKQIKGWGYKASVEQFIRCIISFVDAFVQRDSSTPSVYEILNKTCKHNVTFTLPTKQTMSGDGWWTVDDRSVVMIIDSRWPIFLYSFYYIKIFWKVIEATWTLFKFIMKIFIILRFMYIFFNNKLVYLKIHIHIKTCKEVPVYNN